MSKVINIESFGDDTFGISSYFLESIEAKLGEQFSDFDLVEPLKSAVHHALFPKGKRIRPLFSLLLCHDLQGDISALLNVATALEFVHCASLIHDDLPALDDDDFRRGRPACHKAFGEGTALLAGDVLTSMAFEIIAKAEVPSDAGLALVYCLSEAFRSLCNGQQLDISPASERGDITYIHKLKTGTLFGAAAYFAGVMSGLKLSELETVQALGTAVGTYFQITDDYIDQFGTEEERGRLESSDKRNQRETIFNLSDQDQSRKTVERVLFEIKNYQEILKEEIKMKAGNSNFKGLNYIIDRVSERMG